ncbi:hypothetical protein ACVMB2_003495 [Sinorhizobium meliloti]
MADIGGRGIVDIRTYLPPGGTRRLMKVWRRT